MTQPLQLDLVATPSASSTLGETLDETIHSLATFDADRLETLQMQVGALTTTSLARELTESREAMPELLRKHTLLREMLNATTANLRVVAAVMEAKRASAGFTTQGATHDRSKLVSWPR